MKKLVLASVLTLSVITLSATQIISKRSSIMRLFFGDPDCQLPFCDPDAPPNTGGGGGGNRN